MKFRGKYYQWILIGVIFSFVTSTLTYWRNYSEISFNSLHFSYYHSLIIFDVWDSRGLAECKGSPCLSYSNPGDKSIPLQSSLIDENGNCFYAAHPPFGFLVSWWLLKIFHLPNSFHSLLFLNAVYFFVYGVLLAFLLAEYLKENDFNGKVWIIALLPVFILVSVTTQKFFSTFFFLDNATLIVFTAILALIFRIASTKSNRRLQLLAMIILQFLVVYCDWIGIFLSATLIGLANKLQPDFSFSRKIKIAVLLSTLAAVTLVAIQYSTISGWSSLVHYWRIRFISRSGIFGNEYSEDGLSLFNAESYKNILQFIWHGFAPLIILICVLLMVLRFRNRKDILVPDKYLLLVSFLPIALDYLIFFNNHASHSFYTVWLGIPGILLLGSTFKKLFSINRQAGKILLVLSILITAYITFAFPIHSNGLPEEKKIDETAQDILSHSSPDRAIVLQIPENPECNPSYLQAALTFKMKRNLWIGNVLNLPSASVPLTFTLNPDFTLKK